MRLASGSGSLKRRTNRSAVSSAFCAFLILPSHVLALADDSATSQHLIPMPSCLVTEPIPSALGRSASVNLLAIGGLSASEMADASHLFVSKFGVDSLSNAG